MRVPIFLSVILVFLMASTTGCDKIHAKKLAKKYQCTVHQYSYMMGTNSWDTVYNQTIEVTRDGSILNVLGYTFHIDSLWKGKEYSEGDVHNNRKIQFINDSIYFSTYSGGLGGGGGSSYAGFKID